MLAALAPVVTYKNCLHIPHLQLAGAAHLSLGINHSPRLRLVMLRRLLTVQTHALVDGLCARRHVEGRILVEEVDGLEHDLEDLAWHDGEVLDARHVVDAKLHEQHDVSVDDVVVSGRPRPHAGAAARLVRVLAAGVQFAVPVGSDVDAVVGEFGTLEVEAVLVGKKGLEGRGHDLVCDRLAIDGVALGGILNLEQSVLREVEIETGRFLNKVFLHEVARAMWIEVRTWHWMSFVVHEPVSGAVKEGIYTEREDMLVMHGKNARMDDSAEGYLDSIIDRLSGKDTGCSHLVVHFSSLVEHEGHNILVIGNRDYRLEYEFTIAYNSSASSTVVGVLPADTRVLLVDTDYVRHVEWFTCVTRKDGR